jgi:stearoyl-CoA desaturase (Delta-9 desaturase)
MKNLNFHSNESIFPPSGWLKMYWYQLTDLVSVIGSFFALLSLHERGITFVDVVIFLFMFILTVIGAEIGFHRLFSHKSFQSVKPIRIFLAIAGSMTGEASVIDYVAYHRCHHAFCDQENDPHSPHQYSLTNPLNVLKSLWYTYRGWKYNSNQYDWRSKYAKDLEVEPEIVAIDQAFYWIVFFSFLLPFILGLIFTASVEGAWTGFYGGVPLDSF